ncbi:MAG: family transcriptional regulator [Gemmatimonadetes bacterium]|nr:family transcriptional regulator [Gemmatimonadota bacterium]
MATLREKLGRAVRKFRSDAGFSQERFADACRFHRTYIGSIERGEINISLDNIERVAHTLNLPVSRLFLEAEHER